MTASFLKALQRRVVILDGAMGTQIHSAQLDLERDYLGRENCIEVINLTRPEVVRGIHEAYLEVGCDAVETNTFGGMPWTLREFELEDRCHEINLRAAQIAREACDLHSSAERPRFAVGSMGPGSRLPTLDQIGYQELAAGYCGQARALLEGGVDALLIETCQDPLQIKGGVSGAARARGELGRRVPILVSVTMEVTGTMLVGTEMAAAIALLDPLPVDLVALNCATGPREMSEHVRLLGQTCRKRIGVYPNAGLPQLVAGETVYPLTPRELADWLTRFVEEDGVGLVGGCCGTTPEHMRAVARALDGRAPLPRKPSWQPSITSTYGPVALEQENSILYVGERANANGSKKFRKYLLAEDRDAMVRMGKAQIRDGSHVIDLCTAYVGRDEAADMRGVLSRYRTDVAAPLMIDSTDPAVIRAALELCGGRCIVNSINLEDGPENAEEVIRLAVEHGAALVCLTIDENGMARTAQEKLRIARRLYGLCVEGCGMRPEDLLIDVLTFTICTGNEEDRQLGVETLEGIRRVREELPGVGLLLGLSNISFGLDRAARHVLNSVFLHHAQEAGLTAAILHAARIEPLHRIAEDVRVVAEDLIFDRRREGYDPLQAFLGLFEGVDVASRKVRELPEDVFERLRWRIVEGEKKGLEEDLDLARQEKAPIEIVNTDLLGGMARVGELFSSGEMQLPFVLQSAETMKAAVRHLEPHMKRVEGNTRGRIVLGTVRGDVHDIGKNLADIILTNNGYTVFNLGIKQPIERFLQVAAEHQPDAIGMSGLLVKSTLIMRENLEEMSRRGLSIPVILGGAALTRSYVQQECRAVYDGPVYYAKDAFEGLATMDLILRGVPGVPPPRAPREAAEASALRAAARPAPEVEEPRQAAAELPRDITYPEPPFLGPRVEEGIDLEEVLPFVNLITLFQFQWDYRRKSRPNEEYKAFIDEHVRPIYRELAAQCAREGILRPQAAWGYWRCIPEGDHLVLLNPEDEGREVARFELPRQRAKKGLCIADFFHARDGRPDVVALQAVTVGQHASDVAREWFGDDRYQDYLHLHGFSVEVAEGLAEYVHRRIRAELGIADEDAEDVRRLFKQGYRGSRFSFGYPACPRVEDQAVLLDLLGAERIGIRMGEGDQLWPELSTSAVVCHHPSAKYFTL